MVLGKRITNNFSLLIIESAKVGIKGSVLSYPFIYRGFFYELFSFSAPHIEFPFQLKFHFNGNEFQLKSQKTNTAKINKELYYEIIESPKIMNKINIVKTGGAIYKQIVDSIKYYYDQTKKKMLAIVKAKRYWRLLFISSCRYTIDSRMEIKSYLRFSCA